MSEKVRSLVLDAKNWHDKLRRLQEIIEICLEQLEDTTEGVGLRVDLLVSSYLADADAYLDELNAILGKIQRQAAVQDQLPENWVLWQLLLRIF